MKTVVSLIMLVYVQVQTDFNPNQDLFQPPYSTSALGSSRTSSRSMNRSQLIVTLPGGVQPAHCQGVLTERQRS